MRRKTRLKACSLENFLKKNKKNSMLIRDFRVVENNEVLCQPFVCPLPLSLCVPQWQEKRGKKKKMTSPTKVCLFMLHFVWCLAKKEPKKASLALL